MAGGIVGAGDHLCLFALVHVLAQAIRSKAEATRTDAEAAALGEDALLIAGAGLCCRAASGHFCRGEVVIVVKKPIFYAPKNLLMQ